MKVHENTRSQTAPREPNTIWNDIKEEGQWRNSLSEFQTEQCDDYTDMLRKADEAGYAPSAHHLMDIRRQMDDTQAWIDMSTKRSKELNEEFERANQRFPDGAWQQGTPPQIIPSSKEEIDLRLGVIALEIAEKKKQLDQNITYEDIMDLDTEMYIANSQYNLEERHKIEEEILKLTLEKKNLLHYKYLQGLMFPDNILGQPAALLTEGILDEDLTSDYSTYKKDPLEERKRYILAKEALLDQFQENNKQTLDDNSLYPEFLRDMIHDIPRDAKNWAATEAGKKIGFHVSGGNSIGKTLGGAIANGADTYNATFGQAFRGFLQSGVDEETAKKAAHDEAIIVAYLNAAGGMVEDKVSDSLTALIPNPVEKMLAKNGIKLMFDLPVGVAEEILSEENKNRTWSGEINGGAADLLERAVIRCLFLKGFDEG